MAKSRSYTRREVLGTMTAAAAITTAINLPAKATSNSTPQTRWRVERYSFGWNATQRRGIVRVWLANYNRNPFSINVATPQEFAGYVTILKEDTVFIDSSGWLYSGAETVG